MKYILTDEQSIEKKSYQFTSKNGLYWYEITMKNSKYDLTFYGYELGEIEEKLNLEYKDFIKILKEKFGCEYNDIIWEGENKFSELMYWDKYEFTIIIHTSGKCDIFLKEVETNNKFTHTFDSFDKFYNFLNIDFKFNYRYLRWKNNEWDTKFDQITDNLSKVGDFIGKIINKKITIDIKTPIIWQNLVGIVENALKSLKIIFDHYENAVIYITEFSNLKKKLTNLQYGIVMIKELEKMLDWTYQLLFKDLEKYNKLLENIVMLKIPDSLHEKYTPTYVFWNSALITDQNEKVIMKFT